MEVSLVATKRINTIHPQSLIIRDPTSVVQTRSKALEDPSWVDAMQEKMQQFKFQNVWILVDLPAGHIQEEGIDYDEVFALVARIEAIRLFLAFASYMGFLVYQIDVKSVFLYGRIDKEVYVTQPKGFVDPQHPKKVYNVVKALYGLHQAPRAWYATLSTFLLKHGYRRGTIDKTLFLKKNNRDIILVQVYVDDIIFRSTKKAWCDDFKSLMKGEFQMSAMGELTFFLSLQVQQRPDGIFIHQDKYVNEILNKFDLGSVRMATTPYEAPKPKSKNESDSPVNVHLYRSMIGSLMYLTALRPDIMFAVNACSRHQVTPTTSNLEVVKNIFKYLKVQPKLGLWYPKESPFMLEAYSDSDYAGANKDRKSTTGGCQFLGRRLIPGNARSKPLWLPLPLKLSMLLLPTVVVRNQVTIRTMMCQPITFQIDFSGSDQIQTPQYPEIHLSSQETSDKVFQTNHFVQNEESSNEIAVSNSNQEKEEPPQDSDIRQLIREECCVEVPEKQKQNIEDTMLELVKNCQQKEFLCIHDDVDDL
nr:putative ribonuclease H-like domain-containing protein [Tanacetum cinerariifolium]